MDRLKQTANRMTCMRVPEDSIEWEDGEPKINLQDFVSEDGELEEDLVIELPTKDPPEWMTDMDIEILEVLSSELTLTPSIIAENIDRSREGVSQRLSTLQAGGYVTKQKRGKYSITPDGLEFFWTGYRILTQAREPERDDS